MAITTTTTTTRENSENTIRFFPYLFVLPLSILGSATTLATAAQRANLCMPRLTCSGLGGAREGETDRKL